MPDEGEISVLTSDFVCGLQMKCFESHVLPVLSEGIERKKQMCAITACDFFIFVLFLVLILGQIVLLIEHPILVVMAK